jgi:hypothetical protein
LLPTLVATALALAGCGDTPAGGPGGSPTTLPDTSGATSTAPTTTAPPTTSSSVPSTTTPSETMSPTKSSAPGAATPAEAIGVWMDAEGHTYAGDCAATTIEDDIGKYCSSLCKASADEAIYKVGPTFSEYTTWLLLEKSDAKWRVVDTAPDTGTAPAPW